MEKELRRRRWIVRRKVDGWANSKIAAHLGISKRTVIRWWKTYKEDGWEGLEVKSRRPKTIHKTDQNIVRKVIELREKEGYGPNKMEAVLRKQGIEIGHSTIYRILKENGLNNPIDKPRKIWGKKRFERKHINSLWQADFKLTEDDNWMITFLDDHSRFVTGCKINHNATGENAIKLLERSIKKYGTPTQVLTDQGTQFINPRGGITAFTNFCTDNGIKHIKASKRRPTTIGKVERWHRTYEEEHYKYKTLRWFVYYYNFKRPHQSLGYLTPSDVYLRERVTHVVS
jgi:transposase InsO family protein